VLFLLASLGACGDDRDGASNDGNVQKINGDVHVMAGKPAGTVDSVNGSIQIDDNATVASANTINGSIHVGDHATSGTVRTVNGTITVGAGAHVSGSVVAVNGALALRSGADVAGAVSNIVGDIRIDDAHVGRGIKTVAGDIEIFGKSQIEGGIAVEKPSGQLPAGRDKTPHVVIGPGAIVQGELRFDRPVRLDVSNRATIGPVVGATPATFTGDEPPS
jgi:DUF4097 and DUF4098 domain-containing protein YvlB